MSVVSFTTALLLLYLTSLTQAVCVCTSLSNYCNDGYNNTCGSFSLCDVINITTDNFELTQECIDSNGKVPYLEMYAKYFTLQDNFFETSGGIHFKRTTSVFWSGFNNFEQLNEVTYVDKSYIVHTSALNMKTDYLYIPSPVDFNMNNVFSLSGDAIIEFGGNINGEQYIWFNTNNATLKDESILNISTAQLTNPLEFTLYDNSKLISAAAGKNSKDLENEKFYFYDSSTLVLDEGYSEIYLPFSHYFYNNSILQVERNTKSKLGKVNLNDNSLLNISESSFINIDYFLFSSNASIEIGEDSVIQTPVSSLNGEITFNNKARLSSLTSTSDLPSSFLLNVIETIIGYPIISLWNENSILDNIEYVSYNGNECIDVYSFASSNDDLTIKQNYNKLANNQLIRYCPSSVDVNVHCYLNTSVWNGSFIDSDGYPIFISPHCMNSYYSNYLCHSIQNTFEVGSDPIDITFVELLDTIIISETSTNQQIINGCFNIIETSLGLKINPNMNSSTLKGEIVEPNTFISIGTSTTINTINDEIQLDLSSFTAYSNVTYSFNASIIEIIDNSFVTLKYKGGFIEFTNNYQIKVAFTQHEIGLYSKNGFNVNEEYICYFSPV
ncbi:hypothetical protein QTN25_002230 [Entamoeba marina]